eukprot:4076463-Amphidinium_carterae.2
MRALHYLSPTWSWMRTRRVPNCRTALMQFLALSIWNKLRPALVHNARDEWDTFHALCGVTASVVFLACPPQPLFFLSWQYHEASVLDWLGSEWSSREVAASASEDLAKDYNHFKA